MNDPSLEPVDAAKLEAYRVRARAFLDQYAATFSGAARTDLGPVQDLALGRAWQRLKSENGYAAITLPREYGGGGGTDIERIVFAEEENAYRFPTDYFRISLNNPVPIVARWATDEQKERLLPPAIRGDEIWCQLFSEPAAGSDLAALRLTARRQGDNWVLNGQKLWTSWAQYAAWGVIVARTDPDVPKHRGLTYFFLDMQSPGITVRPIPLLDGSDNINEVFFDEVVVPDQQRLGQPGDGFRIAIETLMIERYGVVDLWGYGANLKTIIDALGDCRIDGIEALHHPALGEVLADALVEEQALGEINRRAFEAIQAGRSPGPEGSINKLLIASKKQRLARAVMDLIGPDAVRLPHGVKPQDDIAASWLVSPLLRIAGGTDQILRNTIAERILELPQDYRPDKGVPFREIG